MTRRLNPKAATHTRGHFQRGAPLGGHQVRASWVEALAISGQIAREAVASDMHGVMGEGLGLQRLIVALRELAPENFPPASWSARACASAFLILARAFVRPEMSPEARTACAGFLGEGAAALDAFMTAERDAAAAASWGRQTGERD